MFLLLFGLLVLAFLFLVLFVGAAVPAAISDHFDGEEGQGVLGFDFLLGNRLRRSVLRVGRVVRGGGVVGGGERTDVDRRGHRDGSSRRNATDGNVSGVEHLVRGDVEISSGADARVAGVDEAVRCDEVDVAGLDAGDGREDSDAATGGKTREVGLDGGGLRIDDHAGRRSGKDGLGRRTGCDVAVRGPDDFVSTAKGEDPADADGCHPGRRWRCFRRCR